MPSQNPTTNIVKIWKCCLLLDHCRFTFFTHTTVRRVCVPTNVCEIHSCFSWRLVCVRLSVIVFPWLVCRRLIGHAELNKTLDSIFHKIRHIGITKFKLNSISRLLPSHDVVRERGRALYQPHEWPPWPTYSPCLPAPSDAPPSLLYSEVNSETHLPASSLNFNNVRK